MYYLTVGFCWWSFLTQVEMFLTFCMMSDFLLYTGHFKYYVMRLWILFQSSVLGGLFWDCSDEGMGAWLHYCQMGVGVKVSHLPFIDTGVGIGASHYYWAGVEFQALPRLLLTEPWLGERRTSCYCLWALLPSCSGGFVTGWQGWKFQIPTKPFLKPPQREGEEGVWLFTARWRWESRLCTWSLLIGVE